MKIYMVKWKIVNGGYSSGDSCVSGGYYDTHGFDIVTASTGYRAVTVVEAARPESQVNKKPKLLGYA